MQSQLRSRKHSERLKTSLNIGEDFLKSLFSVTVRDVTERKSVPKQQRYTCCQYPKYYAAQKTRWNARSVARSNGVGVVYVGRLTECG